MKSLCIESQQHGGSLISKGVTKPSIPMAIDLCLPFCLLYRMLSPLAHDMHPQLICYQLEACEITNNGVRTQGCMCRFFNAAFLEDEISWNPFLHVSFRV